MSALCMLQVLHLEDIVLMNRIVRYKCMTSNLLITTAVPPHEIGGPR